MKAKRKLTLLISLVLLPVVFAMTACGGGGGFHIQGKVYEWLDPPANTNSKVFFRTAANASEASELLKVMDVELQDMFLVGAVAGAETSIYPREGSDADALKLYSDADGDFGGGDVALPQSAGHILRTTKSGYKDLVIEIDIDEAESSYAIVVLLVREGT